jgi:hypothetical protein
MDAFRREYAHSVAKPPVVQTRSFGLSALHVQDLQPSDASMAWFVKVEKAT